MKIVRECAVEITFDEISVIIIEFRGGAGDEGGVEVRILLEMSIASSVEKPGRAAPGGRNAFANIALCFVRARWESAREVSG